MKTLYLDCGMGAAGDMLTAALLELFPDPDAVVEELNGLGVPGVRYQREAAENAAFRAPTSMCLWATPRKASTFMSTTTTSITIITAV